MPGDGPRAGPGSTRRLRQARDIARVLRTGKQIAAERVVVYVAPGPGESRAACVAGRQVGGAVARNRARRVLRAAWRELGARVREGHDVVFVARPEIRGARTQDLVEEVGDVLSRAGVIER